MKFRMAHVSDVFPLMNLYQKAFSAGLVTEDDLYLDCFRMEMAIKKHGFLWPLLEDNKGVVVAAITNLVDMGQRLCKLAKMLVDPSLENPYGCLGELLHTFLCYLEKSDYQVEVIYATTLSMSMPQQELTLKAGFKTLGVFPNLLGDDSSRLNGVSGYYFPGVLEEKRVKEISPHPTLLPFYKVVQEELGLHLCCECAPPQIEGSSGPFEAVSPLELIAAPLFVARRFEELKDAHSEVTHFYPFYTPNCCITSPSQDIEIFCRLHQKLSFVAIIGERFGPSVSPIEVYLKVQELLRPHYSYIELINDAGDYYGNDCILKSGFTPCAYLPAFKLQGQRRRDFVVFGKSFEFLCRPKLETHETYLKFYREYLKIEGKNYFAV